MQKRVDFKAQRTLDRIKTDYYNRQLSEVK
jgi:hypothetical protein